MTGNRRGVIKNESMTRLILDSIADGVFTIDPSGRITSFNRAAEQITGYMQEEVLGQYCHDIFKTNICFKSCPLKHTARTLESIVDMDVSILNRQNQEIPISISTSILKDSEGNVMGAVETFRDLSLIRQLQKEISKGYTFQDIVSRSESITKLLKILPDVAESEATVLIQGESGTGKELFATAIHNSGPRRRGPFVIVNCGALPETLLESELFGYKRGAFTDAKRDKPGRFKLAEGGTLFLDEIGELDKGIQVKLLRVLEQKCYEPLGSNITERADVRIVTATNRDLFNMVRAGTFREDLFYRLNVMRLDIPPLRERREDIPILVDHFIRKFDHKTGKPIRGISKRVLRILLDYDYPGNVRELENIIEHAFILCKSHEIRREHLPQIDEPAEYTERLRMGPKTGHVQSISEVEASLLTEVLERHGWDRNMAAMELGMHRTTLWRKLKKYGIQDS